MKTFIVFILLAIFVTSCQRSDQEYSPIVSHILDNDYPKLINAIEHGADVNLIEQEMTPLLWALSSGASRSDSEYYSVGEIPPVRENIYILTTLLEAGADPNLSPSDSALSFPLMKAVYNNRLGSAWLLIRYGAEPLAKVFTPAELSL